MKLHLGEVVLVTRWRTYVCFICTIVNAMFMHCCHWWGGGGGGGGILGPVSTPPDKI